MIYVLMGKSATGKDTVFKKLLEQDRIDFNTVVTYTTRPIREGEVQGKEYNFVNEDKLKEYIANNKVVELRKYNTVHGVWNYFTVDDGQIKIDNKDYLIIGTLESYVSIRDYYGKDRVKPIYIEIEDGERLSRALNRERQQIVPKYAEMCRRFLADCEDFSEEKISEAGIDKRYINNNISECVEEILKSMV